MQAPQKPAPKRQSVVVHVCSQCSMHFTLLVDGVPTEHNYPAHRPMAERVLEQALIDGRIKPDGYQDALPYLELADLYDSEDAFKNALGTLTLDKYLAMSHPKDTPAVRMESPRFQPPTTPSVSTAKKGRDKQQRTRV